MLFPPSIFIILGTFYTLITLGIILHILFLCIVNALMSGICFALVKCQRSYAVKGRNAAKTCIP